jgi:hypothetical protein
MKLASTGFLAFFLTFGMGMTLSSLAAADDMSQNNSADFTEVDDLNPVEEALTILTEMGQWVELQWLKFEYIYFKSVFALAPCEENCGAVENVTDFLKDGATVALRTPAAVAAGTVGYFASVKFLKGWAKAIAVPSTAVGGALAVPTTDFIEKHRNLPEAEKEAILAELETRIAYLESTLSDEAIAAGEAMYPELAALVSAME